jgi:hypothetical protein
MHTLLPTLLLPVGTTCRHPPPVATPVDLYESRARFERAFIVLQVPFSDFSDRAEYLLANRLRLAVNPGSWNAEREAGHRSYMVNRRQQQRCARKFREPLVWHKKYYLGPEQSSPLGARTHSSHPAKPVKRRPRPARNADVPSA